MNKLNLVILIEAAFLAAFALVLDLLPSIKLTPAMSISFAMVPIFIISLRWGVRAGLLSGFLWGVLQVVIGDYTLLSIVQFAIEYFIAFACIGIAGLFAPALQSSLQNGNRKKATFWIVSAVLVGSLCRYFWHFLAGVIFWGSYAPEGTSPFIYSLIVNGGTMLGAAVLCSVILIILINASSRLILERSYRETQSVQVPK